VTRIESISAKSYGWSLDWATQDSLAGNTGATFHCRARNVEPVELTAQVDDLAEDDPRYPGGWSGPAWIMTHVVAEDTFAPGYWAIEPAVAFGEDTLYLGPPFILTVTA
jgi:hypothetical protein